MKIILCQISDNNLNKKKERTLTTRTKCRATFVFVLKWYDKHQVSKIKTVLVCHLFKYTVRNKQATVRYDTWLNPRMSWFFSQIRWYWWWTKEKGMVGYTWILSPWLAAISLRIPKKNRFRNARLKTLNS